MTWNGHVLELHPVPRPWPTVTGLPGGLPAVFENPSLPHQVMLLLSPYSGITVSCNCLRKRPRGVIETRTGVFRAQAAIKAWQRWHQAQGIEVRTA